jgi:hypothetical protein
MIFRNKLALEPVPVVGPPFVGLKDVVLLVVIGSSDVAVLCRFGGSRFGSSVMIAGIVIALKKAIAMRR